MNLQLKLYYCEDHIHVRVIQTKLRIRFDRKFMNSTKHVAREKGGDKCRNLMYRDIRNYLFRSY